MLKKFLTAFMSAVLAVLPLNTAYANKNEQKNYIVKYKSSNISLMSIVKEKDHFDVVDEKTLNKLLNNNAVEWYEEDYDVELFEDNVDDSEKNQNTEAPPEKYDESKWDLKMIEAEFTYMLNCKGQEVKIGVIDSGVAEHEDLIGNISEGYNYIDESTDTSDTYGHGTFVSGIIASLDDGKGIIGLSPQAKIVPLKCFDEKTTKASYICKAIYGAVDDYDCDIINMSFGLSEDMQALKDAVDYAVNKGVIIVAAVGNSGGETLYYPAAYENVIGVGAVDKNGDISSVSEHNESVFITAPGKDINSTNYKGGYTTGSGTSYSTPFISSAVAIMKNVNDEINLDGIKNILSVSSVDKGNEGYDEYYGYGILNMKNCVREIIKDSVCFISPIDKKDGEISAVVYNNTDTDFTGLFITGEYNGKRINTLNKTDLTVSAGKTAEIKEKQSDYSVKYYVWNSLEDNTILSNVRNIETEKTEGIPEDYITITIDLSEYADKKYFSLSVNGYDGTLVYAVQDKIPQNYIYEISVPHNAVIDNNTEEKLCAVYLDSKINGIETSIPADAHNYESTIIPPNKSEKGYTEYTCKVCGYKYIDNETEPIGYFVEYDANGGESAPKKQNKRPEETLILPDDVPIREG
ncbi:MAG: S8 family serine peptidase [Clostridia bacterium]|nr:S8 family serine peptidase [Clostridia bacterium]